MGKELNSVDGMLMKSLMDGNFDMARKAMDMGADVNVTGPWGTVALIWAAYYGRDDLVELMIKKGANPDAIDEGGWTPLMRAAFEGHERCVDLLIGAGANINLVTPKSDTPLGVAVSQGHKGCVMSLAMAGADLTARNREGKTAKEEAFDRNNEDVGNWLAAYERSSEEDKELREATKATAENNQVRDIRI